MVSGAKKGSRACVTRAEEAGKGRRRRGRSFTPLPGDVFSDDARVARGIYRPRGEWADAQAPGNGFFQGNRAWGLTRVARLDIIFMERGADAPGKEIITIKKVSSLEEMPESIGGVSAEERETIIRKDYLSKKAYVCTTDFVEYGKLLRRCREYPKEYKALGYDTCGGQAQTGYFECPMKLVSYRAPASEAQKAAAAANAAKIIAARDASDAAEE